MNGARIYTSQITLNPSVDFPGNGEVNFYAVDADPNGQLSAGAGDRAWQIGSTDTWVCSGGTTWSLEGGAPGVNPSWNVILRPAGTADPDNGVYTTWADAYAAAAAIDGKVTLWIDSTGMGSPLVTATPGTYDMANIFLEGWTSYAFGPRLFGGTAVLQTTQGTVFTNFVNGIRNLSLAHVGTNPLCSITLAGLGSDGPVVYLGESAAYFTLAGFGPIFEVSGVGNINFVAGDNLVFGLNIGSGNLIELVDPVVATLTWVGYGALPNDCFAGPLGSSLTVAGLVAPSTSQANFLGTFTVLSSGDFLPYTPGNPVNWTGAAPTTIQEALDRIANTAGPIA